MADVNANIGVNIDTSAALAQLKDLQRQISQFHSSIAKSSETAGLAQRDLQRNFLNSVNALGTFSAELRTVRTTSESFTNSLEKNKFSMREYFRYAGASTQTFGKLFKSEYDTIGRVAEDRVKKLQTQYIKMGRDASGAMKAIAIIPNELDMSNFSTQTQLAAQKQALFNQLMKQGSTNLLNFGKNTQWAGRQLMVGFTLPLMAVGSAAAKTFMQMEEQALKFKKVYGDLFTPQAETQKALEDVQNLGREFTKYGIAVADTVALAADAAAAGFQGIDLQRQTTEATRLSVLGQIDNQQALETTIALQNAFKISSEELAQSIDFLNAVENQTVVSLDDVTIAIPKVAPVIQQLGGDVKDLAFFLTAMKEGGINASEGANALKSGLASLINPSTRAREMLQGLGIDIVNIVNENKGDIKGTVIGFAQALDTLAPLERARAIEQMFGKFQFARLSALFSNVTKDGTQAARVLDLAGASVEDLANLSEQELGKTANSAMNKFRKSVEDLKFAIVPVGEAFLKAITPIIDFVSSIAEKFANLSDGTKKAITLMVTVIGGLGPILLMTFGLLANGVANIIKLFLTLRMGYQRLTGQSQNLGEQTQYLTSEQIEAAAAAHSLNQAHATLTQQFTVEAGELQKLIAAYQAATSAAGRFAATNPGMMVPPRLGKPRKGFASGGIIKGPGTGKSDSVPIMASNGEAIIDAQTVSKNKDAIDSLIKTGQFVPKIDLSGSVGSAARSSFSYSGVNRLLRGEGLPGATIGTPGNMPSVAAPVMKSGKYGQVPIGPDNKPAQYGHITTRIEATVDDFLKELLSLPAKLKAKRQTDINRLTGLQQAGGGQASVNSYTSLATWQSDTLNQAVGKGESAVPTDMFVKDMEHFGTKMWIPALKDGGTTLKQVDAELNQYHSALKEAIVAKGKENKTGKITGQQYEKLEAELRQTLPSTSKLRKALDQAAAKIDEYRINIPSNIAQNIKKNNPNLITGQGTHESLITSGQGGKPTKIRLKGDRYKKADILGRQSLLAAQQAGQDLGNEATKGAAKGAATQSPSKKTIKVGEDIARGLQVGMKNQQANVAKAGETLASGAVSGTRRSSRAQGAPGSLPLSQATQQIASMPKTTQEVTKFGNALTQSTPRLARMNGAIQSGSFALMSLSGVAQMFGGKLGAVSNVIFNLSGALFALQTITQLLTKSMALDLVVRRANAAAGLAGALSFKNLFVGAATFGAKLLRLGKFISNFLGPWGKVAALTVTIGGILFAYHKAQKEAKERTEAFSNALKTSTEQIKSLGDYFGISPTVSALEQDTGFAPGMVAQRSEVDKFRQSEAFDKYAAPTAKAVKNLNAAQATQVLNAKIFELLGAGFSKEQIQIIIQSIQQEAKKTDLKIDFENINLDKLPEDILKGFEKRAGKMKKGAWISTVLGTPEERNRAMVPFKAEAAIINKYLNGVSSAFISGQINGKQFTEMFNSLSISLAKMPDKQNAIKLLDIAIENMSPSLAIAAKGVKDLEIKMLLLKAASIGLGDEITKSMVKAAAYAGPDLILRDIAKRSKEEIQKMIDEQTAGLVEAQKALEGKLVEDKSSIDGAKVLSAAAKLNIARMQKELDLLKTKRDKINETNDALKRQYEYQQKIRDLQKSEVEARIRGDYIGAAMFGQARSLEAQEFNKESDSIALDKKITDLSNRISALQANEKLTKAEQQYAKSKVVKKAMGGLIKGPGTGRSDSILAGFSYGGLPQLAVSNGEYIVQSSAVQRYGVGFMNAVNNKQLNPVSANTSSSTGSTVYNIDMVINGGDAGTIADQVIRRLKIETSKNNKTNMVKY
jgi:TP901 family phage tail tape measure protein